MISMSMVFIVGTDHRPNRLSQDILLAVNSIVLVLLPGNLEPLKRDNSPAQGIHLPVNIQAFS